VDLPVYDFTIVTIVITLLAPVWRHETNPFVGGFLTAIIYLNGIFALKPANVPIGSNCWGIAVVSAARP
jgi:hypothetical protein